MQKHPELTLKRLSNFASEHELRGTVRLSSSLPVKSAAVCDLLEEDDQLLDWANSGLDLQVTPFKLVTLKLTV